MKYFILLVLVSFSMLASNEHKCETNKKFIKAYNYISRLKNVTLTKSEIIDFSSQISSKCHNTFERFDEVFELTEKTDLSVKNSIIIAIRIALDTSIDVKNFTKIFKFLVSPSGPDLPFQQAMDYAEKFAKKGNYTYDLIKEIYDFCQSRKEIAYTKMECVGLGERVADLGIKKKTIFNDAYLFFLSHKYLKFNYKKSIDETLKILKYGHDSFEDFKKIFNFALKKNGINVSQKQALEIALAVLNAAEITPQAKKEIENENKKLK